MFVDTIPDELRQTSTSSSHSDPSPLSFPSRGRFSISTVFVSIFLILVAILGACLIAVSMKFSSDTNQLETEGSNQALQTYMDLLNFSNSRLINASNFSVDVLTTLILEQVNYRVATAIQAYTGTCQFCVSQMAEMLETGELSTADMDYNIKRMWRLYRDFPSVSSLYFTAAAVDNHIAFLRSTTALTIAIRDTDGTVCRECLKGNSNLTEMYFGPNTTSLVLNNSSLIWTGTSLQYEPTERPWYTVGLAGQGSNRWTAPYAFAQGDNIGITASREARGRNGETLGVAASDLTLSDMSTFILALKLQLDTHYAVDNNVAGEGFQMALVDEGGSLLATSTGDALSSNGAPLGWREAIGSPNMRAALEIVSAACGGNWSALLDDAAAGAAPGQTKLRIYPANRSDLLVSSLPYDDGCGLRVVLLSAVPVAMYRQQVGAWGVWARREGPRGVAVVGWLSRPAPSDRL